MKNKILLSLITLIVCSVQAFAQTMKISGNVTSKSDGEPLIGATVKEVGTQKAVITDFDGNFTIDVNAGAQLVFSYVGFETQTIEAVDGMKVIMSDAAELQELVVTGYQVQRKADLTGSVGVVETKDIKTSSTDPMSSLQGKVAGMTITSSGSPAGEANIQIRGIGSMGGSSTAPLFIIDGVPSTSSLNSLNASDIESMQVLKDAASASIYGSRAANGVILVTTKNASSAGNGSKSFASVSYDMYFGVQNVAKAADVCNAQEYMQLRDLMNTNGGNKLDDWESLLGADIYAKVKSGWKGTNWLEEATRKNALSRTTLLTLLSVMTGPIPLSVFPTQHRKVSSDTTRSIL